MTLMTQQNVLNYIFSNISQQYLLYYRYLIRKYKKKPHESAKNCKQALAVHLIKNAHFLATLIGSGP
jgi:hypothetical protein